MQLLNVGFAILLIKMAICILPGIVGLYLILASEEKKREIRNDFCGKVFGVSNAIPFSKFERTMIVVGSMLLAFTFVASWFLLLRNLL